MESNVSATSMQSEDDFSIISRQQQDAGPSFQTPFLFEQFHPKFNGTPVFDSSPLGNSCTDDSVHLYTSHHALETAYEHMKRRLSELENINSSLYRRLKSSNNNLLERSPSTAAMSNSHENEVTKAWEAYSDKCRECEKLRDDVRLAEQRLLKSQNAARGQSHREDMLRAQSQQEEHRRKLQQAELEIRDHKNKQEMAREELQKEKEYYEVVRVATAERHHEMESTIAQLQQTVQEKTCQNQELIKEHENQRQIALEMLERREGELKEQIDEMEGRVIREQEERVRLEEQVAKLQQWKEDMERMHAFSGLPLSVPHHHQQRLDDLDTEADSGSDVDAADLICELHSLTDELTVLKRQASMQSSMLSKICEDPRIHDSLLSLDCNGFSDIENDCMIVPIPCTEEITATGSGGESARPSIDTRQIMENTSLSSFHLSRESTFIPSPLAISRQIHAVEGSMLNSNTTSSTQRIEIPPVPDNLSSAFNNIRLAKSNQDVLHVVTTNEVTENPTSYYSAVTESEAGSNQQNDPIIHPLKRSRQGSLSSDSGTGSSNIDTLTDPVTTSNPPDRRLSPLGSPVERVALRYPPTFDITTNHQNMQAIWPSGGANLAGANLSPIWPPAASSGGSTSFDVISGHPSSSNVDPLSNPLNPPSNNEHKSMGANAIDKDHSVREFAVQRIRRPVSREPPFLSSVDPPPNHPAVRPTNRARSTDHAQTTNSATQRRRPGRRPSSEFEPQVDETDERAFMTANKQDRRTCPVCAVTFDRDAPESFMQRHINGHFSEDEDQNDFETFVMD